MALEHSDEETTRVARLVRLPPILLCLLLLLSLSTLTFAAKDIKTDAAQIKDGKLYQNLSLIDGSGFTDEKLNSKAYRIYSNQSKSDTMFDFSFENQLSSDNHFLDCSPYSNTCDMKINITPRGRNLKLQNNVFDGAWSGGSASVQKVFFYKTATTTEANGTITTSIIGEETDLTQLYVDEDGQAQVIIRFYRPSLITLDIKPKLFGKQYDDWAFWDGQACSANKTNETFAPATMGGGDWYDWGAHTQLDGGKVTMTANTTLTAICNYVYVDATTVHLLDGNNTRLANATVSNASGTPCGVFNYNLTAGASYYFKTDSGGASYHGAYLWPVTFPNTFTYFNAITGTVNGADNPTNWGPVWKVNLTSNTTNTSACVIPSTFNNTAITPANNQRYIGGTTSIDFTFNCSSNNYASMLANITLNGTANTTAIPAANNTIITQAISFNQNSTWDWAVNCYNGTTNQTSGVNRFAISNFAPNITSFGFTANGTAYQLGPMAFNTTYIDFESATATLYYSVFKNGSNQTAMAGTANLVNNTLSNIYLDRFGPFNPTDYWNVSVFVSDGGNQSAAIMSNNTTIGNYFSNITSITAAAYSNINFRSYLNMTLTGAATASGIFNIGGVNTSAVSTAGPPVYLLSSNQPAPHATALTNYAGTWYLSATLSNGSTFSSYNATGVVVPVNISGMFLCNSTLTPSIYYNIIDAVTLAPINGTLSVVYTWIGDNGNSLTNSFTQINNTTSVCVTPTFNQATTASETTSATGYLSSVVSVPAFNYSSVVVNRTISLINSTFGGYYTFQVINQFNAPVSNALVIINKSGTIILNSTTDINGFVFAPLQQLTTYQITASATGYITSSFAFTAGSVTTSSIMLQAITPYINATSPYQFINNVSYSIGPAYHTFTTPTNLTLNISSWNNSLLGWGWVVTFNGTIVNTQTSTAGAGGNISYAATQVGAYQINIWFIQQGFGNFTPNGVLYRYVNNTGVGGAASTLQTGTVISPFTYYIIALICALMAAAFVSQYTGGGGAAVVGLIVLAGFTLLWPDGVVVNIGFADLTTTAMTMITAVLTFAVLYLMYHGV